MEETIEAAQIEGAEETTQELQAEEVATDSATATSSD